MKDFSLNKHQQEIVTQVTDKILNGYNIGWISLPTGIGVNFILLNIVEKLFSKYQNKNILFLTRTIEEKEQLISLYSRESNLKHICNLTFDTYQKYIRRKNIIKGFDCIVCKSAEHTPEYLFEKSNKKPIILGCSNFEELHKGFFSGLIPLYIYTYKQAVADGYLFSSGDMYQKNIETEVFCKRVFEQFNIQYSDEHKNGFKTRNYDLLFHSNEQSIFVEVKSFRDKNIPLSRLSKTIENMSLLSNNTNNISVLVVFGNVANVDKRQIYLDYGVTLWDISNLLFYIKDNSSLQYNLTKILPFSIASIEPQESSGWLPPYPHKVKEIFETIPTKGSDLTERLEKCSKGKKAFAEYESICSDIIKYLFDDEFSITKEQHNSADNLFRMDLICSLKGNSEFWRLLIQHYNSRFIVFEYKNYNKHLDQNLIYITEKYLFNAALRNVAIIISREGFSKNAETAARGCLKENGKLIIDITDNDLIQMINIKDDGEEPADYLLNKLENYLMSFSK